MQTKINPGDGTGAQPRAIVGNGNGPIVPQLNGRSNGFAEIDQILSRLEKVRQNGRDAWMACCPAHEDRTPSLSVKLGDNGRVLLYCHAGCTYEAIMGALGMGNGHAPLSPARPVKRERTTRPVKQKERGNVVATYDYVDAAGVLLFQKLRYESKDFSIRRPIGNGRFVKGMGDAARVLYRLPELLDPDRLTESVFVTEGEKDADRLASLGLLATTNYDGAGKWRSEYNEWLTGRVVYVLEDNDDQGRKHVQRVASELSPVAVTVTVVALPGLPEKGDVSDWLDMGGTVEKLLEICATAPVWTAGSGEPVQSKRGKGRRRAPLTAEIVQALTNLGYEFKLNTLDDTVEVNGEHVTDPLEAKIINQMYDQGFTTQTRIKNAYLGHAYDNRYHPIRSYLNSLVWDGQPHIERLCDYFKFAEHEETGRAFILHWLLGAVGKVMNREQNFMLVLDGPQDLGKSSWAKWLCPLPEYFIEGAIAPEDKDSYLRLIRHWIWEVGELQGTTRRADREALKDFITRDMVTVRKAYGRHDLKKPACASLIGTINESGSGFLDDKTGNRRFAVVHLAGIDWSYTQYDVTQVWAEVASRYARGERGRLTSDLKKQQAIINASYSSLSTVEEWLWAYYEIDPTAKRPIPATEILSTLENNGLGGNQRSNMTELGQILKAAGALHSRPVIDGRKTTAYTGIRAI